MSVITITSENDVYDLLEQIRNGDESQAVPQINFSGWPVLTIKLTGEEFDQSITTGVMKGILDLQSNIYRSYAVLKNGDPNANKLSKDEKKMLEISVKVEKGSSDLSIDFQQAALELMSKMNSTQAVIVILAFLALYFGHLSYAKYLEDRKNKRQEEAKNEEQRKLTESLQFISAQETERLKVLKDIIAVNPRLHAVSEYGEDARAALLKRTAQADEVKLQGIEMPGDIAEELAKNAVRLSRDIRLDGFFEVLMVDTTVKEGFKVKIKNINTGYEFLANIQDETLDYRNKQAIQEGEWRKQPVYLVINAKQRTSDDVITSAVIIQASMDRKGLHE